MSKLGCVSLLIILSAPVFLGCGKSVENRRRGAGEGSDAKPTASKTKHSLVGKWISSCERTDSTPYVRLEVEFKADGKMLGQTELFSDASCTEKLDNSERVESRDDGSTVTIKTSVEAKDPVILNYKVGKDLGDGFIEIDITGDNETDYGAFKIVDDKLYFSASGKTAEKRSKAIDEKSTMTRVR